MPQQPRDAVLLADLCDLLAALVALGLMAVAIEGRSSVPRIGLTLAFACYVPGRAIVSNLPALGAWSAAAMPLVFSLAVLTLAATVTLWARYWHPLGLFQAEAAASLAGLAAGLTRRHLHAGGAPGPSRAASQRQAGS
jgi:hypothetical protein